MVEAVKVMVSDFSKQYWCIVNVKYGGKWILLVETIFVGLFAGERNILNISLIHVRSVTVRFQLKVWIFYIGAGETSIFWSLYFTLRQDRFEVRALRKCLYILVTLCSFLWNFEVVEVSWFEIMKLRAF